MGGEGWGAEMAPRRPLGEGQALRGNLAVSPSSPPLSPNGCTSAPAPRLGCSCEIVTLVLPREGCSGVSHGGAPPLVVFLPCAHPAPTLHSPSPGGSCRAQITFQEFRLFTQTPFFHLSFKTELKQSTVQGSAPR